MKRTIILAALVFALAAAAFGQGTPAPTPTPAAPAAPPSKFKVGDVAPDFELVDTARNKVKLSDFRGKKNVVLAFYVLAFTGG